MGTVAHHRKLEEIYNLGTLHCQKLNPNPKFLGMAKACFVCHIGQKFQNSSIYAFIGCPLSVIWDILEKKAFVTCSLSKTFIIKKGFIFDHFPNQIIQNRLLCRKLTD